MIIIVTEEIIKDYNNKIKCLVWVQTKDKGVYTINYSLPEAVIKHISKQISIKNKYTNKEKAIKSFKKALRYINDNPIFINKYGYHNSLPEYETRCHIIAKDYRNEFTKPRAALASKNISKYYYYKYQQHYFSLKDYKPKKLNKKLKEISKEEFENKLRINAHKHEYVDNYYQIFKYYIWSEFYFNIYIAENKEGEPILFIFY
jgi:hypothetical protein